MARKVRQMRRKGKHVGLVPVPTAPDIDARVALIQALIPVALDREGRVPGHVRWTRQRGSVYLADHKLPVEVPRVRDQRRHVEMPLPTYDRLQHPRTGDTGLYCTRCSADCRRASTSAAPRPCRRRSG